jgi:hypothetical protein
VRHPFHPEGGGLIAKPFPESEKWFLITSQLQAEREDRCEIKKPSKQSFEGFVVARAGFEPT